MTSNVSDTPSSFFNEVNKYITHPTQTYYFKKKKFDIYVCIPNIRLNMTLKLYRHFMLKSTKRNLWSQTSC